MPVGVLLGRFIRKTASLPLVALAAALIAAPQPADAQGLFDALFGGPVRKQPRNAGDFPPPPPAQKKSAAKKSSGGAIVAAPSYNTYRPDTLVRVDFAALLAPPPAAPAAPDAAAVPAAEPAAFTPSPQTDAFRASLPGLQSYELFAEADAAKAIVAYYSANPGFIWIADGAVNDRAREAIRVLSDAASYGLSPADYAVTVPSATAAADPAARNAELARFEMALSARVLRYVRDAQGGRIEPNRISGYYDFAAKPLDRVAVLNALAHTQEVRTYLESRHPQNPEYQALRVELEALRASAENDIVVDPKLLLKPGETSAELPKLLTLIGRDLDDEMGGEYGELLARLGTSETYVPELKPLIAAAQVKAGLKGDGVIGPRTVAALAGTSKADRLDKVAYALEELRWLPSDLGSPRVFINQPAFTASYIDNGAEQLKMRVVIGKTSNQTSFFYDEIEQVDYNPYWGVPQSIIVNEMLPRLRNDPGYLDRSGYEVFDAKGKRISSSSVAWGAYGGKAVPFAVRQAPSEANALGELKILFPNKHAIYMHDTPSKSLFQRDVRAFSHGCVRLADPRGMAAAVLGQSVDYVAAKLKKGHSSEKVVRKIPVYVAYFTAWPDMSGKVEYFNDIYGRDDRLKNAIASTEAVRVPPQTDPVQVSTTAPAAPAAVAR